ncbi:hypothetical protein BDZ45DRAFT_451697 [Acephala macrosclerotiorum]|nr:hypothetical protein BDZ45DRAFT_451697 [Acephala macrosclerotiorum]
MVTRGKTKADFCKRWMKISDETKACGRKGGMISTALHGKSIARIFSPSSTSPAHFYFYSHLKERMAWRSSAEAGGVRTSIMMRWRPEAKEANHTELRDKGMMLFLLLYKAHAKTRTLDLAGPSPIRSQDKISPQPSIFHHRSGEWAGTLRNLKSNPMS